MRIRKHAKISPLLYPSSSLKPGTLLQTHVCQLNQSPWDAMTFSPPSSPPPPRFQANGSDARAGNESSDRRVSVDERFGLNDREPPRSEYPVSTHKLEAAEEDSPPPPPPVENEASIVYCCKTDGKSWQCRREAAEGNSLCEHHLSLGKSYSNDHGGKRSAKPAAEAPRRPRPKKAPAASSSNPYEFYYYSGFGPRWGKRRGEKNSNGGSSMPKNVQVQPAAISLIGDEDFDFDYEFEDEDDDDDDDEEEEARDNGKKRMRKPIKARSLKSLL